MRVQQHLLSGVFQFKGTFLMKSERDIVKEFRRHGRRGTSRGEPVFSNPRMSLKEEERQEGDRLLSEGLGKQFSRPSEKPGNGARGKGAAFELPCLASLFVKTMPAFAIFQTGAAWLVA